MTINLRKSEDKTLQRNNTENQDLEEKIDKLRLYCNDRFGDQGKSLMEH
jgi:hypothetical protein